MAEVRLLYLSPRAHRNLSVLVEDDAHLQHGFYTNTSTFKNVFKTVYMYRASKIGMSLMFIREREADNV